MRVGYETDKCKMFVNFPESSVRKLRGGGSFSRLLITNNRELHEKMVRLRYCRDKRGEFASIEGEGDGYLITLGPRNLADLEEGAIISGQYAKGSLEFDVMLWVNDRQ